MVLNNPTPPDRMYTDDGVMVRCKKIDLGVWDMQTTAYAIVNHGITDITKIISITSTIIQDSGTNVWPVPTIPKIGVTPDFDIQLMAINTTQVVIARALGGQFDSPDYNDGLMNRGYMYIWYLG